MGWRWWHFLLGIFVFSGFEKWFGWSGSVELLGRCWWMRVVRGTGLGPSLTAAHSEAAPNLSPSPRGPRCAGCREYRVCRENTLACICFSNPHAAWTVGGGQLTGRGGWGPPLNAQQSVKAPAHPGTAAGHPRPSATMPAHPPHPPLPTTHTNNQQTQAAFFFATPR